MTRLLLVVGLCALAARAEDRPKVLFLTHSAGYQHAVIKRDAPDTLSFAEKQLVLAAADEFEVVCTKSCAAITRENLAQYRAVVFYTSGEIPIDTRALIDYVNAGGGFVGIHPASDTLYKVAPYGTLVGAYFNGHPWHQKVRVRVEDKNHPTTAHLAGDFEITDEIYQFRGWDRSKVHVLLSLDAGSVDLAKKGVRRKDKDFALSWCKDFGRGRVFYTALGHRAEVWNDPRFLEHVAAGVRWAAAAPRVDDEGFIPILDAQHTAGWTQAGPGGFRVENGVATTEGGMGLWYYRGARYRNFILKLEFKQNRVAANSGVFVRFPRVDGDPWIPVKEGYEIQIAGDQPAKNSTGSVYSFQAATKVPLKPAGEWNEYEITCIGQEYTVRLNGELVNRFTGSRSLEGMVGLQNHQDHEDSVVSYRDIRVKPLPDDATSYHVLFDGDRTGWRMCGPGRFELADGVLTSRGGMGMLWHEQAFENFILLLDWRVRRKQDNAGVFVRFPDPGDDPWVAVKQGYEIQICDTAPAKHRTGSVYSFRDAESVPTNEPGVWNHYEIRVVGQQYTIYVNGRPVNSYAGDRSIRGHVGMQNHDDKSQVGFKNIRVVALK